MSQKLWGPFAAFDQGGMVGGGAIAFLTDGGARSEIVITNPETKGEERIILKGSHAPIVPAIIAAMHRLLSGDGDPFPESEDR